MIHGERDRHLEGPPCVDALRAWAVLLRAPVPAICAVAASEAVLVLWATDRFKRGLESRPDSTPIARSPQLTRTNAVCQVPDPAGPQVSPTRYIVRLSGLERGLWEGFGGVEREGHKVHRKLAGGKRMRAGDGQALSGLEQNCHSAIKTGTGRR